MSAPPHPQPECPPVTWVVDDLVRTHGLPRPRIVRTSHATPSALLEAIGPFPLDDLLAWAGLMNREPHWWTSPSSDPEPRCTVFASGTVAGLPLSISAVTDLELPVAPNTADVIAAASVARIAEVAGVKASAGDLDLVLPRPREPLDDAPGPRRRLAWRDAAYALLATASFLVLLASAAGFYGWWLR